MCYVIFMQPRMVQTGHVSKISVFEQESANLLNLLMLMFHCFTIISHWSSLPAVCVRLYIGVMMYLFQYSPSTNFDSVMIIVCYVSSSCNNTHIHPQTFGPTNSNNHPNIYIYSHPCSTNEQRTNENVHIIHSLCYILLLVFSTR